MAPKISGRLSQALLSNKIANVLSVFGTLVQAPSSKVKAEHEIVTKRGYVYTANNHRQKKTACTEPRKTELVHPVAIGHDESYVSKRKIPWNGEAAKLTTC